jgi:ankyrin repeat domain-containing protein 17
VLLAMHANVEDRGIKGDCTPLMEAASAGHVDIVRLLIAHGADVNAQSSSGKSSFGVYWHNLCHWPVFCSL